MVLQTIEHGIRAIAITDLDGKSSKEIVLNHLEIGQCLKVLVTGDVHGTHRRAVGRLIELLEKL